MKLLDFETRWHLLTMVQHCSRSGRFDGYMRRIDALRCSDVPDPARCLAELVTSPFLDNAENGYRLTRDDYFPPEYLRDKSAKPRSKASSKSYRDRKARCEAGEHSDSCPKSCPDRDQSRDQPDDHIVIPSPRDGTGPAVSGRTLSAVTENETEPTDDTSWPETVKPGTADTCANCGKVSGFLDGGHCRRVECQSVRRGRAS